MSAKIYDLFIRDELSGVTRPNVHQDEEYWVVSDEGAEATFPTAKEAYEFFLLADENPTRGIKHQPAIRPIARSA